jgi:glycosyltransferase involved in cell wall biosynthesis
MHILLATALPHLPQGLGGSQSSTHELARMFQDMNHEVAVACALWRGGFVPLRCKLNMLLRQTAVSRESWGGYTVFRTASLSENAALICSEFDPDVVLVQALDPVRIASAFLQLHVPTVLCLRDVEEGSLGGDPSMLYGASFVANSEFVGGWFCKKFGIQARVIPPFVDTVAYRVMPRRQNVTFINPIPKKGVDLAFAIADLLPEIPFHFVESWALADEELKALAAAIARRPKTKFQRRTNNMKRVYERAKIVLVPSQWNEAWGRVVSEAHVSGIPVVASRIGGLPESVGPGGILIDPKAPAQEWADAIKRLCADDAYYKNLSAAALQYSKRDELKKEKQAMLWQEVVLAARASKATEPDSKATTARLV